MKDFYTLADLRQWQEREIRLGVIGQPVAHSRSPQMMNAALAHCGLPHRYARFQLAADELAEAFELMRAQEFVGMNITLPHRQPRSR